MKIRSKTNSKSNNHLPLWDWFAAVLLLLALYSISRRLLITEWTENLFIIQTLTFIAGIFGMALGLSKFRNRNVFFFGLGYASFFILWQLSHHLTSGLLWADRISSLADRLSSSFELLITKQEIADPLLFLLSMSILFWLVSLSAGYGLMRKENPWILVVPAGFVIVLLQTYDSQVPNKIWVVAQFLFFCMLLIARVHFLKKERKWHNEKTVVPLYAALNMLPVILGISITFILASWGTPALAKAIGPAERAWQKITEPWKEVQEDFGRAFSSLKSTVAGVSNIYGSSLNLGRGSPKNESLIFEIETPIRVSPYIRFYWRARTYDYYDSMNLGWENSGEFSQELSSEEGNIAFGNYQDRWEGSFNVTVYQPITILFAAQETTWVGQTADLFYNPAADETQSEINYIKTKNPIYSGDNYQFNASVTNTTIYNLKAAGEDYPDWVTGKYLQIPAEMPERINELAKFISAGLDTPYEISEAITQYLRDNIDYAEVIPPIPEGREPIDWVLFDLKQGFCNYYATAEILLLRSLGIPARLAVGYAHGELFYELAEEEGVFAQPEDERIEAALEEESLSSEIYFVRHSDLHAWPEVFFPGIGWVEFEPTLNQDPLERPMGGPAILIAGVGESQNEVTEEQDDLEKLLIPEIKLIEQDPMLNIEPTTNKSFYISSTVSFLVFLLIWYIIKQRNSNNIIFPQIPVLLEKGLLLLNITPPPYVSDWSHMSQLSSLDRSYMEINKALQRLDQPIGPENTPAERADALLKLLPSLSYPIETLIEQYQIGEYSIGKVNLVVAIKSGREIRAFTSKLWYRKIAFHIKYFWKKDREWKIN